MAGSKAAVDKWSRHAKSLVHISYCIGQFTSLVTDVIFSTNRTFLVFGSDDRTYMTAARFPKMLLITITAEFDGIVTFRAPHMPPLPYKVPDSNEDLTTSTCM
jgi:hypothetical protein